VAVSEEFGAAMVALAEAYGAALSRERILIYGDALGDLTIDQVRHAMRRAVRECKFFPSASELRAFAVGAPDDEALVQWTGLCQAAEAVGAYQDLHVDDRATAEALRAVFGSWGQFCEQCADGPALALRRQEFLAAYRQARRAQPLAPRAVNLGPERLAGLLGGGQAPHGWSGHLLASGTVQRLEEAARLPGTAPKQLPE
jgi:hypothetical protein